MNKTVALKIRSNPVKGKVKGTTDVPAIAVLFSKRTPEQEANFKKRLKEMLGEDDFDSDLYEDIKKNKAEIIARNKLTWEHIKALQNAWKEMKNSEEIDFENQPNL
jgi:hypothetical protein